MFKHWLNKDKMQCGEQGLSFLCKFESEVKLYDFQLASMCGKESLLHNNC